MHKQHEDQPSNELPNLSTWHRVPVGATIPKGTPYAYVNQDAYVNQNCVTLRLDGAYVDNTVIRDNTYYTEHPIALPLPTEEGATILASDDCRRPRVLLTLEAGQWVSSLGLRWDVEQFRAWCPVTLGETVVMR